MLGGLLPPHVVVCAQLRFWPRDVLLITALVFGLRRFCPAGSSTAMTIHFSSAPGASYRRTSTLCQRQIYACTSRHGRDPKLAVRRERSPPYDCREAAVIDAIYRDGSRTPKHITRCSRLAHTSKGRKQRKESSDAKSSDARAKRGASRRETPTQTVSPRRSHIFAKHHREVHPNTYMTTALRVLRTLFTWSSV